MSHSFFRACLVALLLLIPALPACGFASSLPALTILDFDDLTPSVDLIQNQYLGAYGVAFDAGRIIVPDEGTSSGRQALRASGFQAEFHQDPLIIYFSGEQSYVGMRVGLVQETATPVKAVLRAYNASGAPIGTADTALIGPGPTPISTLLEITDATGIREVRLHYENTFLFEVIDDLTYDHVETPSHESNAPIVQIWSPTHNGIVLSPHFQLAGTIEEESALADVRLAIGQPGAAVTSFQIEVTGGPPVSNIYGLDSGVLYGQLAEGTNIVKVTATDIHGNTGEDAVTVIYERLAPPPVILDLYPTAIEITQGVQDKVAKLYHPPTDAPLGYGGAVPLVAGKATVVRLHGTVVGTAATVNGVPAELWGYRVESGAVLPGSPLQPANGTIPLTPGKEVDAERARLDGAWIFDLPPAWAEAGAIRLLATVNPGQNVEECPTCYNTGNRLNLPYLLFEPMPDLHLYPFWACVRRAPTDPTDRCDMVNPFAPLTLLQSHDSVLPSVLPTAHMDLHLPANPIIYIDGDFSLGGNMTSPRVSAFLAALAYRRYQDQVGGVYRCINSVGGQSWIGCFTVAENHLYLGLMPPPVNNTVGLARVDSSAAVSVFDPGFVANHSAVVAEELSHAIEFGWHAPHTIPHPNCTLKLPGWPNASYPQYVDPTGLPYPRASIGQWGFEPRPPYTAASLFDPATTFDYMSYCNPSWVSPYTYRLLYDTLRTGFTLDHNYHPFQELFPFPMSTADAEAEYMLVMGEIDADDTVTLQPFYRFTLPTAEMNDPGIGPYKLQVRSSTGALLFERRFDAETALQGVVDGEPALFAELIPFPAGAVEIRIVDDGETLATRTASVHAPQVQLLAPVGGDEWPASGKASVVWSGSDADGDTLFYTVQYSLDNGVSWQTLATDVTTTSVELDLAWLAGAAQAHVRVLASDGMHTSTAQTASPLRVANKPPIAAILAPINGTILSAGQPVMARGLATDREEGPLSAGLSWLLDGVEAGQGDTLYLTHLAAGAHQLTLRAEDSGGLQTTATSTFTLTHPAFAVTIEELAVETVCGGATHTVHVGWRTSGGSGGVTVERITVSSYEMDIAAVEGPLASEGETSLQLHLDGGGSATVSLRARDGSGQIATAQQTVAAGHCLTAGLAVDRSPLDFAFVEVGMSQTLTLSLSNVGSAPITLTGADGLAQPFAFAATPAWPLTLQPGARTAISVRFTPMAAGAASSELHIRLGADTVSLPVIGEGRNTPLPPSMLYLPSLMR